MEFFLLLFVRLFCVISVPFDLSVLFLYGLVCVISDDDDDDDDDDDLCH